MFTYLTLAFYSSVETTCENNYFCNIVWLSAGIKQNHKTLPPRSWQYHPAFGSSHKKLRKITFFISVENRNTDIIKDKYPKALLYIVPRCLMLREKKNKKNRLTSGKRTSEQMKNIYSSNLWSGMHCLQASGHRFLSNVQNESGDLQRKSLLGNEERTTSLPKWKAFSNIWHNPNRLNSLYCGKRYYEITINNYNGTVVQR